MYLLVTAAIILFAPALSAQNYINNILYARDGDRELLLDLSLPDDITAAPPLLIWIHGGNWRSGDKDSFPTSLLRNTFAHASIDFRNIDEVPFPGQIHDIRAAIRFLRANAWRFGYDPDNIALWGYSTGGHLALLSALAEDTALEGTVGEHPDMPSSVKAVVAIAAQTNLLTLLEQSTTSSYEETKVAVQGLFRDEIVNPGPVMIEWLRLASPVMHVSRVSPPVMLMHGLQDLQVPASQPLELLLAYQQLGIPIEMVWLPEADHFSGEFFAPPLSRRMQNFLEGIFSTNTPGN